MSIGQQERAPQGSPVAPPAASTAEMSELPSGRQRRRPMLLVAFVALTVLGSLIGVLGYTSLSSTTDVVAVRASVAKGETIDAEDLRTVSVSVDASVATIPAEEAGRLVVGHRAAVDLPKGALVSQESIAQGMVPRAGKSVVGVTLPASQLPGEPLEVGDRVRVVDAPGVRAGAGAQNGGGSQADSTGEPTEVQVEVAGVRAAGDETTVSVIVDADKAGPLASRAATGRVVIILDSRER